jgi:adenylate kinase
VAPVRTEKAEAAPASISRTKLHPNRIITKAGNFAGLFFAAHVFKKCAEKSNPRVVRRGGNPMIRQSSGEAPCPYEAERSETRPGFTNPLAAMQKDNDRSAWLKGGLAQCRTPAPVQINPYRFVLLGAPGVGKGTQAELLSSRLGACHLSTGDIFRTAKTLGDCERTPTMNNALEYMRRGDLVPDEIVLGLVVERGECLRCGGGFLLDGFPRTVTQAEALEECLKQNEIRLSAVLSYDLPLEKIVSRLSGRRTCPTCKAVYHVETRPSKTKGICDSCGTALYQREDDRPESVRVRMDVYEKSTSLLADFYRRKGLLVSVSAEGTPEEIFERTLGALKRRQNGASWRRA